jgi:hypothetical protein
VKWGGRPIKLRQISNARPNLEPGGPALANRAGYQIPDVTAGAIDRQFETRQTIHILNV